MRRALSNRRRLSKVRRDVAACVPQGREQQRVKLLLIAMLDAMEILHCRPGMAEQFDQAWEGVELFRASLQPQEQSEITTTKGAE